VEAEPHFVVTGVKRARKGKGIVVRGYDAAGRGAFPVIRLPEPIVSAVEVNLLEEPLPKSPARIKDGRAMVKVGAHRITTLLLDTADSSR
jgi:alpha-mannosidase